jgi:hypothetical protein
MMNLYHYWSAKKYDVKWSVLSIIALLFLALYVVEPYHSLLGSSVQLLIFFPVVNGAASSLVESSNENDIFKVKLLLTIFVIIFACVGVIQAEIMYLENNGEGLYLFPAIPIFSFLIGLLIFTPVTPEETHK